MVDMGLAGSYQRKLRAAKRVLHWGIYCLGCS